MLMKGWIGASLMKNQIIALPNCGHSNGFDQSQKFHNTNFLPNQTPLRLKKCFFNILRYISKYVCKKRLQSKALKK